MHSTDNDIQFKVSKIAQLFAASNLIFYAACISMQIVVLTYMLCYFL